MLEQVREHAVVDHVLDEAAQLGVRADLGDDLVERHRIEHQVVAQRVQLQRLVVDARPRRARATARLPAPSPRSSRRGSRFPSSARCSRAVGADRVPGRQAGDVRREHVLADTGTPIWKMERSRTRLAVWLPEPLTVATWMLKSLTIAPRDAGLVGIGSLVVPAERQLGASLGESSSARRARRSIRRNHVNRRRISSSPVG